jgi:hypothetical protein
MRMRRAFAAGVAGPSVGHARATRPRRRGEGAKAESGCGFGRDLREDGNPEAAGGEACQQARRGGLEGDVWLEPGLSASAFEYAAYASAAWKADERAVGELGQWERCAAGGEEQGVLRGHGGDQWGVDHDLEAGARRGIGVGDADDGEVEFAATQGGEHACRSVLGEGNLHLWVLVVKVGEQGGQVVLVGGRA